MTPSEVGKAVIVTTGILAAGLLALGAGEVVNTRFDSTPPGRVSENPSSDRFTTTPSDPVYPLKVGDSRRYLVDQNGKPFMIVGDSPQSMIGRMSDEEATYYLSNRQRYGINALWINLLCNSKTACNADGTTNSGIPPFVIPGNITTPNPDYFDHVDRMLRLIGNFKMVVLLDPAETIGWLDVLRANGPAQAEAYGRYLGARYRNVPNIIWMHGNDFQTWKNPDDDRLVLALAKGIMAADPNHLHTIQLNYLDSASFDDPAWRSIVQLDGVYTYFPTYAKLLDEYNRADFSPIFMVEASYEFEHLTNTAGGSTGNLRRQEYWTMLSGATGQLYGSHYTWTLPARWKLNLDTPGVRQLALMKKLFSSINWQDLVPDQGHRAVTAGYGTPAATGSGSVTTDTYVTAARTRDGQTIIAYLPTAGEITIDLSSLAASASAYWYDPSDGNRVPIPGSPFSNSGERRFASPGLNQEGGSDWVLMLDARRSQEGQDR